MNDVVANVALELFAGMMLLVIIIYLVSSKYRETRANRIFLWALIMCDFLLFGDAVAWMLDGVPGQSANILLWISNTITFTFGMMTVFALFLYVAACIPLKKTTDQKIYRLGVGAAIAYCAVFALLQSQQLVFRIDEQNVYWEQSFYWLPVALMGCLFLLMIALILFHRRQMDRGKTTSLLLYSMIPFLATIANMVYKDLMFAHVSMAFALLIVFVNIQVQQERALAEKESELTKNRIAIMLSQIQPHFLYNALTSISALCKDNDDAQRALITFSEYLRVNMDALDESAVIPFSQELNHTQQYLWLEQLRTKDRMTVRYEIAVADFFLPVLTLQPIVENAVRHGISLRSAGGTVTIRTEETPDSYRISVIDDGVGFDPEVAPEDGRSHIGIRNVRARLHDMCGGRLAIKSRIGEGTTATIEIPKGGPAQ